MKKCEWCKREFEPKNKLTKYCDFCQKKQRSFINTEAKLDAWLDYLDFYLDFYERLQRDNQLSINYFFNPNDLIVDGIVPVTYMKDFDEMGIAINQVWSVQNKGRKNNLAEQIEREEREFVSDYELEVIRRILKHGNPRTVESNY